MAMADKLSDVTSPAAVSCVFRAALGTGLPLASFKEPKTDNQRAYSTAERIMMSIVTAQPDIDIVKCKLLLPGVNVESWIMTSYPVDLLSRYQFAKLMLLESHTGNLREPSEWNRRLSNNPSYARLPFNILTLQVLGDRSTLFNSQSPKVKKVLLETATSYNWTPMTTMLKIQNDIKKISDSEIRDKLFKLSLTKIR